MVYVSIVLALACLYFCYLWLITRRDLILEKHEKVSILRELARLAQLARSKAKPPPRGAHDPF